MCYLTCVYRDTIIQKKIIYLKKIHYLQKNNLQIKSVFHKIVVIHFSLCKFTPVMYIYVILPFGKLFM